jgi:hypothetical protein
MASHAGPDVSRQEARVCVVDERGAVLFSGRATSEPGALAAVLRRARRASSGRWSRAGRSRAGSAGGWRSRGCRRCASTPGPRTGRSSSGARRRTAATRGAGAAGPGRPVQGGAGQEPGRPGAEGDPGRPRAAGAGATGPGGPGPRLAEGCRPRAAADPHTRRRACPPPRLGRDGPDRGPAERPFRPRRRRCPGRTPRRRARACASARRARGRAPRGPSCRRPAPGAAAPGSAARRRA